MKLGKLKPKAGATKRHKRVGCGPGSGHGKTSTRGHKGDRSRSGYIVKAGYEGGQMPLTRRIPKRGFRNIFTERFEILNISSLGKFEANTVVTPELLKEKRMIKGAHKVKILGRGEITIPLTIKVHKISKTAQKKVEQAKGRIEIIS
ncbi:50S ribosomal protein L15 [candidate division WOR-3 bacterium]|nr:50S ribosomal protein L15 [candidate division WOR-3 bacterium]